MITTTLVGIISTNIYGSSQLSNGVAYQHNLQKVVILTFDDGYKSQYSNAKPILDKYGFKATFYIVCNYVGSGDNRMTWEEIKLLKQEGHDIASHTMNHDDLSTLPPEKVQYEVTQSKQCLLDQGIEPKSFAYPFNGGSNDPTVISAVAHHYDLARTATDPLAFLGCSDNCETSKYSIMGWSHDSEKKNNAYNDQQMFETFVKVVNSQTKYNTNGVNAIPILIWHKIDNSNEEYSTSTNLFDAELKYLHDNGFTVLTMADLVYDDTSKYLKISSSNNDSALGQQEPIPNIQKEFATRVTDHIPIDSEKESDDNLSTEEAREEKYIINEEPGKEEEEDERTPSEDNPALTDGDDDTISDDDALSQSDEDNKVEEDTEDQIPSSILRFILEP
ncbi:MAG: polysaccharide deacetylase family protein [Thermoproteota archaeon]|nr:polysaccharide deacetylase family protein [Thermoproteota archaeon]